ncbi:MAG: hypothetical protein WHT27_00530 [candidate division WOR-3 bacterium]
MKFLISGILSFTFMSITLLSGIFLRKFKLKLIHHKILAFITLIFALIHLYFVFLS